jgi:PAS domain S-box-containing protein
MSRQLEQVVDAMPVAVGIRLRHQDDRWVYVNPAMASLLGYQREEMVGTSALAVVAPEEHWRIPARRAALSRGEPISSGRMAWMRKDRSRVSVDVSVALVDYEGAPCVLVFGRDLTETDERERALLAMRQSETMFSDLFAAAPDAILLVGRDGTIRLANAEAHRVFGFEEESLVGTALDDLLPASLRAAHARHRDTYFGAPRLRRMGESLELVGRRRNGSELPVDVSLGPFSYRGEPAVLGVVRDLTERRGLERSLRRAEEHLQQAEKLRAVGTLASGVAHDFNNLLSVMLTYATLVLDDLAPGDSRRADVEEIQKAGRKAFELTRQLLAFNREQVLRPVDLDLNEVLAGMEPTLQTLLRGERALSVITSTDLGQVHVDLRQVEQVVLNLVMNARDATPVGGSVRLETASVHLDDAYVASHREVAPGIYAMLAVTDTGVGMDPATRDRIFEPFFTTKERGNEKGTGLGLSTVYGIVKQAGGHIAVHSEPSKGTTFQIYFPRTSPRAGEAP